MGKFEDQLEKGLREWLWAIGQEVLDEAQKLVPVASGKLKGSVSLIKKNDGFVIKYDTDYAAPVHDPKFLTPMSSNHIQNVPSHWRQTSKGKVRVKAHTKKFKKGWKPVPTVKDGWYSKNVDDPNSYKPKNEWISRAYKIVYNKLDKKERKLLPSKITISTGNA
tara:strand:+ start:2699 stop:3190 length:492 start_codon:yes stop_codon:yes gene_type:complete